MNPPNSKTSRPAMKILKRILAESSGLSGAATVTVQQEATMQDPFVGTWKLNTGNSQFDPNHRPSDATMVFELSPDGRYVMKAEGVNAQGQKVAERPQTMIPDGKPYP